MTDSTPQKRRATSEWMFYEHVPGSLFHDGQALNLALLRLLVVAFYLPIFKPLMNWMTRK